MISHKELFGYTMDEIVQQTLDDKGYTKACSYCGVFRRQALNIGAERTKADLIATGHNADDNAETGIIEVFFTPLVMMNVFRGDINRLTRQGYSAESASRADETNRKIVPRCKPLR